MNKLAEIDGLADLGPRTTELEHFAATQRKLIATFGPGDEDQWAAIALLQGIWEWHMRGGVTCASPLWP